ncbi:hypothetical protein MTO96_026910 [Rhipicephalus appendiculatus]
MPAYRANRSQVSKASMISPWDLERPTVAGLHWIDRAGDAVFRSGLGGDGRLHYFEDVDRRTACRKSRHAPTPNSPKLLLLYHTKGCRSAL